jgi:hypothetical protein
MTDADLRLRQPFRGWLTQLRHLEVRMRLKIRLPTDNGVAHGGSLRRENRSAIAAPRTLCGHVTAPTLPQ